MASPRIAERGDVPLETPLPTHGYPSLAAFMASDRDRAAPFIFKRFGRLSARNLLHLESELAELECRLDALDEQDKRDPDSREESLQCARSWQKFKQRCQREPERMELIRDIRSTMREYSKIKTVIHLVVTFSFSYLFWRISM